LNFVRENRIGLFLGSELFIRYIVSKLLLGDFGENGTSLREHPILPQEASIRDPAKLAEFESFLTGKPGLGNLQSLLLILYYKMPGPFGPSPSHRIRLARQILVSVKNHRAGFLDEGARKLLQQLDAGPHDKATEHSPAWPPRDLLDDIESRMVSNLVDYWHPRYISAVIAQQQQNSKPMSAGSATGNGNASSKEPLRPQSSVNRRKVTLEVQIRTGGMKYFAHAAPVVSGYLLPLRPAQVSPNSSAVLPGAEWENLLSDATALGPAFPSREPGESDMGAAQSEDSPTSEQADPNSESNQNEPNGSAAEEAPDWRAESDSAGKSAPHEVTRENLPPQTQLANVECVQGQLDAASEEGTDSSVQDTGQLPDGFVENASPSERNPPTTANAPLGGKRLSLADCVGLLIAQQKWLAKFQRNAAVSDVQGLKKKSRKLADGLLLDHCVGSPFLKFLERWSRRNIVHGIFIRCLAEFGRFAVSPLRRGGLEALGISPHRTLSNSELQLAARFSFEMQRRDLQVLLEFVIDEVEKAAEIPDQDKAAADQEQFVPDWCWSLQAKLLGKGPPGSCSFDEETGKVVSVNITTEILQVISELEPDWRDFLDAQKAKLEEMRRPPKMGNRIDAASRGAITEGRTQSGARQRVGELRHDAERKALERDGAAQPVEKSRSEESAGGDASSESAGDAEQERAATTASHEENKELMRAIDIADWIRSEIHRRRRGGRRKHMVESSYEDDYDDSAPASVMPQFPVFGASDIDNRLISATSRIGAAGLRLADSKGGELRKVFADPVFADIFTTFLKNTFPNEELFLRCWFAVEAFSKLVDTRRKAEASAIAERYFFEDSPCRLDPILLGDDGKEEVADLIHRIFPGGRAKGKTRSMSEGSIHLSEDVFLRLQDILWSVIEKTTKSSEFKTSSAIAAYYNTKSVDLKHYMQDLIIFRKMKEEVAAVQVNRCFLVSFFFFFLATIAPLLIRRTFLNSTSQTRSSTTLEASRISYGFCTTASLWMRFGTS
jgi:hypothetical protein